MNDKKPQIVINILALFLVVILGVVLVWTSYDHYQDINSKLYSKMDSYLYISSETIEGFAKNIEMMLSTISKDIHDDGIHKSPKRIKEIMESTLSSMRERDGIGILFSNANGDVVTATGNSPGLKDKVNISNRDFFVQIKKSNNDAIIFTEPFYGRVRKKWIIAASKRVVDNHNRFAGVVVVSIPTDLFENFFSRVQLGGRSFIQLIGPKNISIFKMPNNGEDTAGLDTPVKLDQIADDDSPKYFESNVGGVSFANGTLKVSYIPFNIIVGFDRAYQFREWIFQIFILGGVFVFAVIVAFAILRRYYIFVKRDEEHQLQMTNSARLASLGEMAGAIAHEINNPLAIISARAQHIEANVDDKTLVQESAARILLVVNRISSIIIGLKLVSRDSSGEPFNIFDLNSSIDSILEISNDQVSRKGIKIFYDNFSDHNYVMGNSTQLMQVFLNLLNNSIDAIEKSLDKWISIETRMNHPQIEISFTDSGSGIDEKIRDKIMEPFFTTKPIGKGTGLGLSISKGIIERHGGKFFIDASCKNTRFVIQLPLRSLSESAAKPSENQITQIDL